MAWLCLAHSNSFPFFATLQYGCWGPKVAKAHFFLSLSFGIKREIRAFAKGSSGAARGGKKEMILWVETPKGKSLLGISVLGFEEEE